YRRDYNGQTLLVISNFYGQPVTYQLPEAFQGQKAETLITNYEQNITEVPNALNLQPYEAIALLI
ncbi:MAG: alpha-glucosidase C-terminal domain-containing protein, partial [Lactobacillus sp.]|nr:alpha-glucosidase C-terminal domain-containing protein [Lactobacillus sp.]